MKLLITRCEHPKILHFIETGGLYGAEKVILNLSSEMLRHKRYIPIIGTIVQSRMQRSCLCAEAESMGIPSVSLMIRNTHFLHDLVTTAKRLMRLRIRLIHSHGYKPSVYGFFIHLITGIPIIATCHLWYNHSGRPLKYVVMTTIERYLYRYFWKVICVSEDIKNILLGHQLNSQSIEIIYNGIDIDKYRGHNVLVRQRTRELLGLSHNYPVVLNVGRLTEQKNQEAILDTAKALSDRGTKVYFLIAGDGELQGRLQGKIEENGLLDIVRLLGFRDDVMTLLSISDFFLLPSLDEGLPVSMLEAMLAKVPVISTPVGEIPRIIEHGKNGFLIPKANIEAIVDAVDWCIRNQSAVRDLAESAYMKLRNEFTADAMYNSYSNVYNPILNVKRR